LTTAAAVYPNFKMQVGPEAFARAWHRHVGHLSAGQLQAAMDRAVHGSEFFPTVHDVLKAASELASGATRTGLEAWGDVGKAMTRHGNYHPPKGEPYVLQAGNYEWEFEDPLVQQAVLAVGWVNLFEGNEDTMRAHFVRAYDGMKLRQLQHGPEQLPAPAGERITRLIEAPPVTERQKRMAEFTARIGIAK
jgi:hypothetical protein